MAKKQKKNLTEKVAVTGLKNRRRVLRTNIPEIRLKQAFGSDVVTAVLRRTKSLGEYDATLEDWTNILTQTEKIQKKELTQYNKELNKEIAALCRVPFVHENFNEREFRYLVSIGSSKEDIAGLWQCSPRTLTRFVEDYYGQSWDKIYRLFSGGVRIALRRAQLRCAINGNATMLKFLGKNMLGQSESVDLSHSAKDESWADLMQKFVDDEKKMTDNEPNPHPIQNKIHQKKSKRVDRRSPRKNLKSKSK